MLNKFLFLFNILTPAFLCVCPLIDDKVHHDIVTVAVDPLSSACGSTVFFDDSVTCVMKFIISERI